jgi:RHS repeat-associated protein
VQIGTTRYDYNGLNQRVRKTVGGVTTTSFYNSNWQELESQEPGALASGLTVFIWGKRYIDDLILREKGQEKLYALADPNWNVVALTNTSGTVVERMKYDGFGKITWMNAAFTTIANSAYAWNRTFTGQVLDSETGLMLYRNRYYHTGLGRFVSRDPIGYYGGDINLMRYVGNRTTNWLDIFGLTPGKDDRCRDQCSDDDIETKKRFNVEQVAVKLIPSTNAAGPEALEAGGSALAAGTSTALLVGGAAVSATSPPAAVAAAVAALTNYIATNGLGEGVSGAGKTIKDLIMQNRGFSIWSKVKYQECEKRSCWCFWTQNRLFDRDPVWYGCKLSGKSDLSHGGRGVIMLPNDSMNPKPAIEKLARALIACAIESIDAVRNKKN